MIGLMALLPFLLPAQIGSVLNRAKYKAQQRADNHIDKAIDKGLDAAEGKSTEPAVTKNDKPTKSVSTETTPATEEEPSVKSYSKFDFVPGDKILYFENFDQEAIGEMPTGWNTNGSGEVVTLSNIPGKWLKISQRSTYLTNNEKEFGENYTVEFDVLMQFKNDGHFYPYFSFGLFSSKGEPAAGNDFLTNYKKNSAVEAIIYPADDTKSKVNLYSYKDGRYDFKGTDKFLENLGGNFGKPVHVAIQVQKERFRMWVNEEKVYDVPKGVPAAYVMNQLQFQVHISNYKEGQYGMFISNLKVATGLPDTRHKLVDEGKFSTTGILFDFQSAVIKPGSYGVVKEIAQVLKDNASLKIKVIGHTSSDGDDAANLELSRKRSAAVKELLVSEFAIGADRIQTDGKGETQPVADNASKEGKALNRRVEFIKQ